MKYCPYCCQNKPFDPSAKPHSKLSGFHMARCWDCYKVYSTNRARKKSTEEKAEFIQYMDEQVSKGKISPNYKLYIPRKYQ